MRVGNAGLPALVIGGVALLTACGDVTGSGGDVTSPTTLPSQTIQPSATESAPAAAELTVTITTPGATGGWTLRCDATGRPAGGDHPAAEQACRAIAVEGVFDPPPKDQACTEIYGGPQTATVTGTVGGAPVSADFARSNGCEIARWDALTPLLQPGSPNAPGGG